jgi:membrane protease YdiL (CAAX protease family)
MLFADRRRDPVGQQRLSREYVMGAVEIPNRLSAAASRRRTMPAPVVRLSVVLVGSAALVTVQALLIARGHVLAGQIADGLLLLIFANAAWILDRNEGSDGPDPLVPALRALGLVALIPLVAAGLPLREFSQAVSILLVAGPVGISAIFLARSCEIDLSELLRAGRLPAQVGVALTGVPLGFVAYTLGAPSLPTPADKRLALSVAAVALAAAVEEVAFRGVLQQALQRAIGRHGVVVATGLFAASYLGVGPAPFILTVAWAGAIFAASVARTGALGGAIAGHAALAVGASVVWPAALGHERPVVVESTIWTSAIASVLVATSAAILLYRPGGSERP